MLYPNVSAISSSSCDRKLRTSNGQRYDRNTRTLGCLCCGRAISHSDTSFGGRGRTSSRTMNYLHALRCGTPGAWYRRGNRRATDCTLRVKRTHRYMERRYWLTHADARVLGGCPGPFGIPQLVVADVAVKIPVWILNEKICHVQDSARPYEHLVRFHGEDYEADPSAVALLLRVSAVCLL